jgi:hypothetical protein
MDPVLSEPNVPVVSLTAAAPASTPPAKPPPLISDQLRRPGLVGLVSVLPLALLLWSGWYAYWIVGSELSPSDRGWTFFDGAVLLAVTAAAATIALRGLRTPRLLTTGETVATLLISITAMVLAVTFTNWVLPWSLPEWMISRDELLYRSFCLAMPGAFYALLLLASGPVRRGFGTEFGKAFAIVAGCLGGVFLLGYTLGQFARFLDFPEWVGISFAFLSVFGAGTLLSGAVIRLTLLSYTSVRRLPTHAQQGFMFLIAIAGPLGGLWLNHTIPFPADFQAGIVFILTAINGVLLLLPVVRSVVPHRLIWLAQCVMFPFSAYFFIVFLPWLPLAPFAMIIIGSGFLMLVPLVLGLVHGYRIVDGAREEIRDGQWWKPALLGLAATLVLPTAIGWSMWQDRQTLDEALDYIYAPDYRKDVTFPGDLHRLQNSLQHLRDMKHGVYLPFISPIYNAVVFHGLVLPDEKIDNLQHAFFGGAAIDKKAALLMRSGSAWADEEDRSGPGPGPLPPSDVVLSDVKVAAQSQGAVSTSRLTLFMKNDGVPNSEFVTSIHLPEGVYVSNYGLYIKDELVPARIVEKKTAMWVYEQISRVQHRDPGILVYKSRTDLELRVYPVAEGETRRVELELTHPNTAPLEVTIGDRTVELNPNAASSMAAAITACSTPTGSLAVATGAASFAIERTPYLHILVDCSQDTAYTAQTLADCLRQAEAAFPGVKMARVSAINYEARDIVSDLIPIAQLDAAAIQKALLPSRGSLLEDRFLKRGLLQAYDLMQQGAASALMRPQFVLISPQTQVALREGGLENFLRLAPDAHIIYAEHPGGAPQPEEMAGHNSVPYPQPGQVVLWQWADHFMASPATARTVAAFPAAAALPGAPLLYQAASHQFVPVPPTTALDATSRFGDGVRTWAAQDEASLNPALLQDGAANLIGLSKKTRILIPDSSYIAVESIAQWRAMEEKEKLKLQNKQVFELSEQPAAAPEPATWWLLLAGLALLGWRRRADSKG